jgi:hypothetical protein
MSQRLVCVARTVLVAGALIASIAAPAAAQDAGVRAGVSVDPDQFYFGGHIETKPIVDRLRFRPNLEVGLGDDTTLVAINIEFAYFFRSKSPWELYAGAGPALNIVDRHDDSDLQGGLNFLVGVQHRDGLFFEFKVGAIDSPNLKFGVGYTWR